MTTEYTHTFFGVKVTKDQQAELRQAWENRKELEEKKCKQDIKHLSRNLSDVTIGNMIVDVVCRTMELDIDRIKDKTRRHRYSLGRKMCSYFMKEYTNMIMSEIAILAGRTSIDHAMTDYDNRKVNDAISIKDMEITKWVRLINDELLKELQ